MDHYDLLRVTHDASAEEIKKSYQKLVLQFHPDKSSTDDSSQMFQKIDEAYKVLKDPELRRTYDSQQFQCNSDSLIIHDTVRSSEFQFDAENECYYHICKCGGYYILQDECKDEEYLLHCDECSLVIKIINVK